MFHANTFCLLLSFPLPEESEQGEEGGKKEFGVYKITQIFIYETAFFKVFSVFTIFCDSFSPL
jgi:hypothetical protein